MGLAPLFPEAAHLLREGTGHMPDRDISTQTGTALVALETRTPPHAGFSTVRPDARLLTQLLAMRHDAPVYRQRRRDEPAAATDAYRRAAGLVAPVLDRRSVSI